MKNKAEKRNWVYLLPDGTTAYNMKDARLKMGLGNQGFRALVRKGIVTKAIITEPETPMYGYESNGITNK